MVSVFLSATDDILGFSHMQDLKKGTNEGRAEVLTQNIIKFNHKMVGMSNIMVNIKIK